MTTQNGLSLPTLSRKWNSDKLNVKKNCDKLSYDVSHKASCGTLCLLCYGIFPYSFSYVSLANAFGTAQLTQLLSSKLIQTAVIFKSFFKTEKPTLRCHQYLFAPQAVWKSSRLHSAVSDKQNIIFLSMLLQDCFKCWLGVDLNSLRKNSFSIMAICRISHFLKFKCEIVHYTYLFRLHRILQEKDFVKRTFLMEKYQIRLHLIYRIMPLWFLIQCI